MKKIILLLFCLSLLASCSSPNKEVLNIAHRGASAYAIEHSIEAYERALQQGADYLEIDLQMTRDGVLIIEHDEFPPYGDGRTIQEYTYPELASLERSSTLGTTPILTLKQVIEHFPEAPLYIETKLRRVGVEEALIDLLEQTGRLQIPSTLIFQSFSSDSLKSLHTLAPDVERYKLLTKAETKAITDEEIKQIAEYADGLISHRAYTDKHLIKRVHDFSLSIHVYSVDNKKELKKLKRASIDGIITNKPDVLHAIINN